VGDSPTRAPARPPQAGEIHYSGPFSRCGHGPQTASGWFARPLHATNRDFVLRGAAAHRGDRRGCHHDQTDQKDAKCRRAPQCNLTANHAAPAAGQGRSAPDPRQGVDGRRHDRRWSRRSLPHDGQCLLAAVLLRREGDFAEHRRQFRIALGRRRADTGETLTAAVRRASQGGRAPRPPAESTTELGARGRRASVETDASLGNVEGVRKGPFRPSWARVDLRCSPVRDSRDPASRGPDLAPQEAQHAMRPTGFEQVTFGFVETELGWAM
jgi:hypothetical protein